MAESNSADNDDKRTGSSSSSGSGSGSGSGSSSGSKNSPRRKQGPTSHSKLTSENGSTSIADTVVAKVAGLAAREIPGVHSMGTGMARRMGQLRSMVPGGGDNSLSQGVAVEVGEREAALDLDVVTWYGQSIVDVTEAVRSNVIDRIESMTGLRVVEVNINVDDVYVEGDEDEEPESRVQ